MTKTRGSKPRCNRCAPEPATTTERPISPDARKLAAAIAEIYLPRLTKAANAADAAQLTAR